MKILIVYTLLFIFTPIFCQTALPISKADSLLVAISQLQIKEKTIYNVGLFPSQRGKYRQVEDNNIFFSSLIAFTLQGIREHLDPRYNQLADSICKQVIKNYAFYQHKSGIPTYNFWKTNPPVFFPNSLLSHYSSFQIPDDADCTAMIYLTDSSLTKRAAWLQHKLTEHSNKSTSSIKNTFRSYRAFKAYSTWFGKRMPIEFDICVQSNILYFIYKNNLSLTATDQETISLLHKQIHSGDYLNHAYYLSPSYKKRSVILYHLARLLEGADIPELQDCRKIVKEDIESELKKTTVFMDKIILSTALIRMKGRPMQVSFPSSLNKEINEYVFFRANLFSAYARPVLRFITKSNLFDCRFYCKAYSLALLAEYKLLSSSNL